MYNCDLTKKKDKKKLAFDSQDRINKSFESNLKLIPYEILRFEFELGFFLEKLTSTALNLNPNTLSEASFK